MRFTLWAALVGLVGVTLFASQLGVDGAKFRLKTKDLDAPSSCFLTPSNEINTFDGVRVNFQRQGTFQLIDSAWIYVQTTFEACSASQNCPRSWGVKLMDWDRIPEYTLFKFGYGSFNKLKIQPPGGSVSEYSVSTVQSWGSTGRSFGTFRFAWNPSIGGLTVSRNSSYTGWFSISIAPNLFNATFPRSVFFTATSNACMTRGLCGCLDDDNAFNPTRNELTSPIGIIYSRGAQRGSLFTTEDSSVYEWSDSYGVGAGLLFEPFEFLTPSGPDPKEQSQKAAAKKVEEINKRDLEKRKKEQAEKTKQNEGQAKAKQEHTEKMKRAEELVKAVQKANEKKQKDQKQREEKSKEDARKEKAKEQDNKAKKKKEQDTKKVELERLKEQAEKAKTEQARKDEEKAKQAEAANKAEEKAKQDEAAQKDEEKAKTEEKQKRDEAAQKTEERQKAEEAAQKAEEKVKQEEAAQKAEEKQKADEAAQKAEQSQKVEQAQKTEQAQKEEERVKRESTQKEQTQKAEDAKPWCTLRWSQGACSTACGCGVFTQTLVPESNQGPSCKPVSNPDASKPRVPCRGQPECPAGMKRVSGQEVNQKDMCALASLETRSSSPGYSNSVRLGIRAKRGGETGYPRVIMLATGWSSPSCPQCRGGQWTNVPADARLSDTAPLYACRSGDGSWSTDECYSSSDSSCLAPLVCS